MQCGNISYSNLSLFSTIMIGEQMPDFLHLLFRAISILLGGMGSFIVLFNEQDNFSCAYPVFFHFYMYSVYYWKDLGKVADSHDMTEQG
jgi:hypothetical protein